MAWGFTLSAVKAAVYMEHSTKDGAVPFVTAQMTVKMMPDCWFSARAGEHFPGAELVFDGWSPFFVWLGNRQLAISKFAGLLRWGFWRGRALDGWGRDIHLLGQWGFFDQPEPRLAPYRWIAPIFRLIKPMRIFHFQLGKAAMNDRTPFPQFLAWSKGTTRWNLPSMMDS